MIIPDGYAQMNVKFTGLGVPTGAEVTFGVSLNLFTGEPADAADEVNDLWVTTFGPQQTGQVGVLAVLAKFGPNDSGPAAEVPGSGTSGAGTTSAPANFSVLVKKSTALGGRKGSGRMFIPGINEATVGPQGLLDGATVTNWQTAATNFYNGLITADLPMVLLHSDPVDSPLLVQSLSVQSIGATQRRRMRR